MKNQLMTIFIFLLLLIPVVNSIVIISEIMYDPEGTDGDHEWIEIYADEPTNLTGWKFFESNSGHKLTLINGSWEVNGYAIIADNSNNFLTDYPEFNGTLFDSSWQIFIDSGEYLALKNSSGIIVNEVNYSSDWGDSEGFSLEVINLSEPNNISINWQQSITAGGTPGYDNNTIDVDNDTIETNCTENWTLVYTDCLINDSQLIIYEDLNNCSTIITLPEDNGTYTSCDNCTPNLIEIITECLNNTKIGWYNDTNQCYQQTNLTSDIAPSNISYFCGNNNSIFGNASTINSTILNLSIKINGSLNLSDNFTGTQEIKFYENDTLLLEFNFNFINTFLNLTNITIEKQNGTDSLGCIIINGLNLQDQTKTVYLDKLISSTGICIKDKEISLITEISNTCTNTDETWVKCPGSNGQYSCTYNSTTNKYQVDGLNHSGVREQQTYCGDGTCNGGETSASCSNDCPAEDNPGGGSGSSNSGGSSSSIIEINTTDYNPTTINLPQINEETEVPQEEIKEEINKYLERIKKLEMLNYKLDLHTAYVINQGFFPKLLDQFDLIEPMLTKKIKVVEPINNVIVTKTSTKKDDESNPYFWPVLFALTIVVIGYLIVRRK